MRKATGSGLPLTLVVKGYTLRPPVLRPMRSVSSMKLSFSVPIWVSALQRREQGPGEGCACRRAADPH